MKQIVIMPGGFHPFHAGHYALYQSILQQFPDADVYVAATNDQSERPFPFNLKEKLAKLAGVAPGRFIQVKSPFKANEITDHYDPEQDVLIFVRSEKDRDESPKPGGIKKDGSPSYYQPWTGKKLQPFSKHAYMAYLPTVTFGPGIKSASEIRGLWPKLNDKRKLAMVYSLYPDTQKKPELAQSVVKIFDKVMGAQGVAESQTAKAGIVQTDVYGTKAYHAKCMEPNCDWESKRYDRIQQAQAAAKKHSEKHFDKKQDVKEAHPKQQVSRYNPDGDTYRGKKMPKPDADDIFSKNEPVSLDILRNEPDTEPNIDQSIKNLIQARMDTLKPIEAKVLKLLYWYDLTHQEIANKVELSTTRIQQIEHKAIRKLIQPNLDSNPKELMKMYVPESIDFLEEK